MAGRLIVISGPSGSGKSSIVRRLLDDLDLVFSVSATTRSPRPGEEDGRHYHFVTVDRFEEMISRGDLLEWAKYGSDYYGTVASQIEEAMSVGRDVLLEIEIQGARQIRSIRPDATMFFLVPPSMDDLRDRLESRGDTTPAQIEERLKIAGSEMKEAPGLFDHLVVNDILERAVGEIAKLINEGS